MVKQVDRRGFEQATGTKPDFTTVTRDPNTGKETRTKTKGKTFTEGQVERMKGGVDAKIKIRMGGDTK